VAYWSDNSVERITFDRCEGDSLLGTYRIALPTGKSVTEEVAFVFSDDGSADFNFTSGPNKGKTLSTWKWNDEVTAQETVQSYGDFMVGGVWRCTAEEYAVVNGELVPTGKMIDSEHRYRWLEDEKILELTATVDGKQTAAVTMTGVDPLTKQCAWWRFGENGVVRVNLALESDGVWRLSGGPNMTPEGHVVSWNARLVRKGRDELHTVGGKWTKNGEVTNMSSRLRVSKRHSE